jgi:sugar transferase (PEP-CTERM/EpsH1 system associated)
MRVLFLTHRLPYAPNRGDRIRAYHIVRTLAARMEVEIVSLVHDDNELAQTSRLRDMGIPVSAIPAPRLRNFAHATLRLAGRQPLTHLLLDAPGFTAALRRIVRERPPDVVLAYCSGMARFGLESPLSGIPLVVDLVDVDSEKWSALSQSSSWPKRWIYGREARHLAEFERRMAHAAATTLVINERERDTLRALAPATDVVIVPNGVDVRPLVPSDPPEERPRVVFCGVMNYTPNVDAAIWFSRNVWPAIRARRPDARFVIVGSDPNQGVRRLHSDENGIEVTGTVDDVRPYLWQSAVAVAPLLTARGMQNKVLEALGAGLPAVVSSEVWDGLPPSVHGACRLGTSSEAFAAETLALLNLSGSQRRQIAAAADLETLSWDSQLQPLVRLLADVAASPAIAV